MTRETLIALTTTIESREWVRRRGSQDGHPVEHPRASNTDDVECFFWVLRNLIGEHFTCKAVMVEWRKICSEYSKRIDRDLPFHYFTSSHERFFEGERPSFDKFAKPRSNLRSQKIRAREKPGIGQATLIETGAGSIRRKFHMTPVDLPPPPGITLGQSVTAEHSYS